MSASHPQTRTPHESVSRWVLRIIEETAPIGTYYWGKNDARTGRMRDREEWLAIPVEPILDQSLFDTAQRVRDERDPVRNPGRTASSPLVLAGLLHCGKCSTKYVLETSGKPNANGEHPYRYYNCRTFLKSGEEACAGHRFPVEKLERAVLEHLAGEVFSVERCRALVRDIVEETGMLRQKTDEERRELKNQLVDIERRIAKWEEAFETNVDAAPAIMPRLLELRAKRDEVSQAIAKVVPLRAPPPHLYAETTIERFQRTIRDLFLSADETLAKNYLRFLVDRVVARGNELEIRGRTYSAVALLASGSDASSATLVNRPETVLNTVGGWLPRSASNKNFATCLVVDFARARKRLRAGTTTRKPRGPEARLARALEWQRQLDAQEVASRAEIARRESLSRARVT